MLDALVWWRWAVGAAGESCDVWQLRLLPGTLGGEYEGKGGDGCERWSGKEWSGEPCGEGAGGTCLASWVGSSIEAAVAKGGAAESGGVRLKRRRSTCSGDLRLSSSLIARACTILAAQSGQAHAILKLEHQ